MPNERPTCKTCPWFHQIEEHQKYPNGFCLFNPPIPSRNLLLADRGATSKNLTCSKHPDHQQEAGEDGSPKTPTSREVRIAERIFGYFGLGRKAEELEHLKNGLKHDALLIIRDVNKCNASYKA